MIVATFSSCFLLLLLLLLLLRWQAATPKIEPLPAANPHGSEGRKSIKIAPKNCLMYLLKPIEKDDFSYFFLLFPPAAAAPATILKPIEKMIVATFSSCFLLLLLLLLRWQAATPKIEPLPAANPHGSEGRKSIKIAPKNCLM